MATKKQMETIKNQAHDDVAREMAAEGVWLSFTQADDIGDEGVAWLENRLGLSCTETDAGLECAATASGTR